MPEAPTTLRDHLAVDRTVLANERTLLAYIRTALALVVVGASALKFFDDLLLEAIGALFIALGLGAATLGVFRFRRVHRRMRAISRRSAPEQRA
ncbi:MAG: DUF202 domain-containing protein [Phycisphaeraceae bacterium]|nr:DUF202 domain-containing protein [Phycisphaeraceae bacterium]